MTAVPLETLAPVWDRLTAIGWRAERITHVARLDTGYRNRMFSVVHEGERFAVRLPRKTLLDAAWYRREMHNITAAATARVTPVPLLADASDGLLVLPWIDGEHFRAREVTPAAAARAGAALRRLYTAPAFLAGEDCTDRLKRRLKRLMKDRAAATAHAPGLPTVAEAARPLLEALLRTQPPPTPCHGDLVLGNMIDTGAAVLLVDWETSTFGDAHYDLATVCVRARLDDAARAAFLDAWFGPDGDDDDDDIGRTRVILWEVLYALDKALTYWAKARREGTIDPRCDGWTRRCAGLIATPGTRAALLRLDHAARTTA